MSKVIYLVSGERSGDLHAVELLSAMEASLTEGEYSFHGLGGSELQAKYGDSFEDWVEEAAVIGFTEVLKKYGWFKKKFEQTVQEILELETELVILVDYPGFNLRLAKALRKEGYAGKICYYISPQVWAWNRKRIPKMAEWLDLMLCVFDFEEELYHQSGLEAKWIGHPMVEELEERRVHLTREESLVGLFPGSRSREVKSLLPVMLEAAALVSKERANTTFELAVPSEKIQELAMEFLADDALYKNGKVTISLGESHLLMQKAGAAWIASGTASLEAGFYGLPYALVYKVSQLTYLIAKAVIKIPYIGMVNILADKFVVKELIQDEATPQNLSNEMLEILSDADYRWTMQEELARVKGMLGGGGAHNKAAKEIIACLQKG